MPRRRRSEEGAGESDSFLDIVANIVGILIILIVVAGVHVSQTAAVPTIVVEHEDDARSTPAGAHARRGAAADDRAAFRKLRPRRHQKRRRRYSLRSMRRLRRSNG